MAQPTPTIKPTVSLISSLGKTDISNLLDYIKINKTIESWWTYAELSLTTAYTTQQSSVFDKIVNTDFSTLKIEVKLDLYDTDDKILDTETYMFDIYDIDVDNPFSTTTNTIKLKMLINSYDNLKKPINLYYPLTVTPDKIITDILNFCMVKKSTLHFSLPVPSTEEYKYILIPYNTAIKNIAYVIKEFTYSNILTIAYLDYDGFRIITAEDELKKVGSNVLTLMPETMIEVKKFGGRLIDISYSNNSAVYRTLPTELNIVKHYPYYDPKVNDEYKEQTLDIKKDVFSRATRLYMPKNLNVTTSYYKINKNSFNITELSSKFIDSDTVFINMIPYRLRDWYIGKIIELSNKIDVPPYFNGYFMITDVDIIVQTVQTNNTVTNVYLTAGRFVY